MATVPEDLEQILKARYGEEVRGSIYDAIKNVYNYANGKMLEEIVYDITSLVKEENRGAVIFFPERYKKTGSWVISGASNKMYGSYAGVDTTVSSDYGYTNIIPVNEGEVIRFTGTINRKTSESNGYYQYVWLKYNDNNIDFSEIPAVGGGYFTGTGSTGNVTIDDTVLVPHGCSGLVVNLYTGSLDSPVTNSLKLAIRPYSLNRMIKPHSLEVSADEGRFDNRYELILPNSSKTTFDPILASGAIDEHAESTALFKHSSMIKIDEGAETIRIDGIYGTGPTVNYSQLAFYSHPIFSRETFIGKAELVNYSQGVTSNGVTPPDSSYTFFYGKLISKTINVPSGAKYFALTLGGINNILFYVHSDRELAILKNTVITIRDRERKPVSKVMKDLYDPYRNISKTFTIKLIGDSITHGMGGTGYAEDGDLIMTDYKSWHVNTKGYCWANLLKVYFESKFTNVSVINYGCSGLNTTVMLNRINDLVKDDDDLVICTIGTNDRNNGERSWITYRIGHIVSAVKGMGKPIILGIPSPAGYNDEKTRSPLHMEDIANCVRYVANQFDMECINFYDEMIKYCDYKGVAINTLLSSNDALHPNDAGYKVMFHIVLRALGYPAPIDEQDWIDLNYPLD